MERSDKLSELVQTVRILNWEVRPKITSASARELEGSTLHKALTEIRNNEIQVSQLIRGISLSEEGEATEDAGDVLEHVEASTIGSRQLLSEFGTARESILSILRNISDEEWNETHETYEGTWSYEEIVDRLIESDRKNLGLIESVNV
ncbi:hypothetical protein BH23CHL2_BH23CHL2_14920 [soil metagenome]